MAIKAKKLHEEHGIALTPNPKPGKKLDGETEKLVAEFYYNDNFSRVMLGHKGYKAVKKTTVDTACKNGFF